MDGWISLHRKILDNPIVCKDADHFAVWSYLLLNATHTEYDVWFNKERITLKPGELITSRKSIADKFRLSESKVQRILKLFESEQQIEQRVNSCGRLIAILNWGRYQKSEQPFEQRVNSEWTASEQRVNTNNNGIMEQWNNVNKAVAASVGEKIPQKSQSENLDADEISKAFSSLKNGFPNIKDEMLITETLKSFSKEDILKVIDEQIGKGKTIKSFAYIKAVLEGRRKDKKEFKARLKPKNVYFPEDEEPVIEAPETKEELRAKELDLLEQSRKYQKEFEKFRRQK